VKIVYVGNFRNCTPAGEPFNTESHLAMSLEALGHQVVRLQEDKQTAELVGRRVAEERPALFLWTRTWPEKLRAGGLEMLRALPCPSVAYHLDLYAGLQRSRDLDSEPWWRCNYVFTADGGSEEFWRAHGVNHRWAPPGVFEPECFLAEPGPERFDVIFVGSGSNGYHPEWPYRRRLIDWLCDTYGPRFTAFGRGGREECVRGRALNRLYASAKVVVGDSLCLGFDHPRYWSDRIPETLGRGGFLIHPAIPGLADYFRAGVHLATYTFGDFDGLRRTIDHYLVADEEREQIRRTGHQYAKMTATYTVRMLWLLQTLARLEPSIAEAEAVAS